MMAARVFRRRNAAISGLLVVTLLPLVLLLGAARHHRPDPPTPPSHSPAPAPACTDRGGGPGDRRVAGPGGAPGRHVRPVLDPTDCPTPAPTPSPGAYRLT